MTDTASFALVLGCTGGVALLCILSSRVAGRLAIPFPLVLLAGASAAATIAPRLSPSHTVVEDVVTVALMLILFEGGMHIGWPRMRPAVGSVLSLGVLGTLLTAVGAAVLLHAAFGLEWYAALLVATAVAPTDPAVVFSVLGKGQVSGRAGTILEGESGANDPVGIALMASLVAAGALTAASAGDVAAEFAAQMGVGVAIGLISAPLVLLLIRRVRLPGEALQPLRMAACALVVYAAATLAHGSGFLAVFVAGLMIGGRPAPRRAEVERFHAVLASLAEMTVFVALGLSIDARDLWHADVVVPAVVLAVVLTVVIRPLAVSLCLARARLRTPERAFVVLGGLKGAVPLLLGLTVLDSHAHAPARLFGVVVLVVLLSVLVQGALVAPVAARLNLAPLPAGEGRR